MTGIELADLQWHWGGAYLITGAAGHWLAQRLDNQRTLTAGGPEELRELIIEDYKAQPVPRSAPPPDACPGRAALSAHLHAAALRQAFPRYAVSVLACRGGQPRIQVVSRDGASPYCLISADPREIWRGLRGY